MHPETEGRCIRRAWETHVTTHTPATKSGGQVRDSSNGLVSGSCQVRTSSRRGRPHEGGCTGSQQESELSHSILRSLKGIESRPGSGVGGRSAAEATAGGATIVVSTRCFRQRRVDLCDGRGVACKDSHACHEKWRAMSRLLERFGVRIVQRQESEPPGMPA